MFYRYFKLSNLTFLCVSCFAGIAQAGDLRFEDLLNATKAALVQVQDAAEGKLPTLESVVIEVNTLQKASASTGFSLFVVEVGGGVSSDYANTIRLTLVPPAPGTSADVSAAALSSTLANAILTGARAIDAAKQGKPSLRARELKAILRFAVTRDANGKVALEFPPIKIGAGGRVSSTEVHTITVTYKEAK